WPFDMIIRSRSCRIIIGEPRQNSFIKYARVHRMLLKSAINSFAILLLVLSLCTVSCSAQTEEQALQSLRQLTKDGKLPAESVVENFERRFAGRASGTLARLLHARIKFETKDFAGAAALLNTDEFAKKTKV